MKKEWLVGIRKQRGLRIKDVARALGVTESCYCRIENGQRREHLTLPMLVQLATVFQLPLLTVIEYETNKNPVPQDRKETHDGELGYH